MASIGDITATIKLDTSEVEAKLAEVEAQAKALNKGASKWSRAVVAKRVGITTAVSTVANVALAEGWVKPATSSHVEQFIGLGFNALTAVVGVLWARDGVTPADPRLSPTASTGEALAVVKALPIPAADLIAKYATQVQEAFDAAKAVLDGPAT